MSGPLGKQIIQFCFSALYVHVEMQVSAGLQKGHGKKSNFAEISATNSRKKQRIWKEFCGNSMANFAENSRFGGNGLTKFCCRAISLALI